MIHDFKVEVPAFNPVGTSCSFSLPALVFLFIYNYFVFFCKVITIEIVNISVAR